MSKGTKSFLTVAAITLVITVTIGVVCASVGEQNISVLFDGIKVLIDGKEISLSDANGNEVEPFIYNGTTYIPIRAVSEELGKSVRWDAENKRVLINASSLDEIPMLDLGFDTNYIPLPDINAEKVIEKALSENQVFRDGVIFEKTSGYEKIVSREDCYILLIDENGNYITVGETEQDGGYRDILIVKYDKDGNEIKRQTYGGSDFDMAYAAKYNPKMGIVISGVSQSKDGDFANDNNTPFVACIDTDTLKVKWHTNVQIANSVFCVTDDAVFIVRNEGEPYNGRDTLKLFVVKLDRDGNKVWQTEPLEQSIQCIAELSDGRIIIVQQFFDNTGNGVNGWITCYDKNGKKLSDIKAECFGEVTPTNDGGFITVSVRNIKTIPQPAYISAIWFDTETVATKYSKDGKVEWRKTYDNVKDAIGVDIVIPQSDGSVIIDAE